MHEEDLSSILLRYSLYAGPSAGAASDEMVWNGLKTIVKGKQVQCYHNHQERGGGCENMPTTGKYLKPHITTLYTNTVRENAATF